jgi:tRNA A-37 threonylcarbamoyl transferase component Bud32
VFSAARDIAIRKGKKPKKAINKLRRKPLVISIAAMCRSAKNASIVRDRERDYVSLIIDPDANYRTVLDRSAKLLKMNLRDSGLVHVSGGTRVSDSPLVEGSQTYPWSIGRYLQSIYSKTSAFKLGLFCEEDSESDVEVEVTQEYYEPDPHSSPNLKPHDDCDVIRVLYAPYVGAALGLDMARKCTREDALRGQEDINLDINHPIPVYPETVAFYVCEIRKGKKALLEYANGFQIRNFIATDGQLSICHQSDPVLLMRSNNCVFPIFCLASNHTLKASYEWSCEGVRVGVSSPVLYVNKPGVYQCLVTDIEGKSISTHTFDVITKDDRKSPWPSTSVKSTLSPTNVEGETPPPPVDSETPSVANAVDHQYTIGGVREFTEAELAAATNSFAELVGKGAFGSVYKGTLAKTPIVVKVMDHKIIQDVSHSTFVTEIQALTRFRHPNLITLMGICRTKPSLVYPFMERLSLYHTLHEYKVDDPISFINRARILQQVGCALAYLHSASPPCVHRDIKSSNILLDSCLKPVVADFGVFLALPLNVGATCVVTSTAAITLAGTRGYLAPEFISGKVGPKCDVYSYGIVCLETFTGLLAYSTEREDECLIDSYAEDLKTIEYFNRTADSKAAAPGQELTATFYTVIRRATTRNFKRRCVIDEVLEEWGKCL